jgi:hypothetical protein
MLIESQRGRCPGQACLMLAGISERAGGMGDERCISGETMLRVGAGGADGATGGGVVAGEAAGTGVRSATLGRRGGAGKGPTCEAPRAAGRGIGVGKGPTCEAPRARGMGVGILRGGCEEVCDLIGLGVAEGRSRAGEISGFSNANSSVASGRS